MRRILLEISKKFIDAMGFKELMELVERLEIIHIYRYDKKNMSAIQLFKMKDPVTHPKDLIGKSGILYLEVLEENDKENEYICLVRTHHDAGFHAIFEDFNLLLDFPLIITQKTIKVALISPEFQLNQIMDHLKNLDIDHKILNISPIKRETKDLKSILTEKQIEVMSAAVNQGYFDIPRKVSSKDLAKSFDISPSALNEHFRKVERKIFHTLFKEEDFDLLRTHMQKKKDLK